MIALRSLLLELSPARVLEVALLLEPLPGVGLALLSRVAADLLFRDAGPLRPTYLALALLLPLQALHLALVASAIQRLLSGSLLSNVAAWRPSPSRRSIAWR